jgi:hypothetical protein
LSDYDPMTDVKNLREMLAAALGNLNTERQRAAADNHRHERDMNRAVNETACRTLDDALETFAGMYAGKQMSVPCLIVFGDAVAAIRAAQNRARVLFLAQPVVDEGDEND